MRKLKLGDTVVVTRSCHCGRHYKKGDKGKVIALSMYRCEVLIDEEEKDLPIDAVMLVENTAQEEI